MRPVLTTRAEAQPVYPLIDDVAIHEIVIETAGFEFGVGILMLQIESGERQMPVARFILAVALILEHRADAGLFARLNEREQAQTAFGTEDGLIDARGLACPPIGRFGVEPSLAVEKTVVAVQRETRVADILVFFFGLEMSLYIVFMYL